MKRYTWGTPNPKLIRNGIVYCPKCNKRKAILHDTYGVLPCKQCQQITEKKSGYPEFTSEQIKEDRKRYKVDLIQPYHGGEPNREFVKHYPKQSQEMFTKQELKVAQRERL